jgi:hypothetical protein
MWSKISKFYNRDDHVKNQKARVEGGAGGTQRWFIYDTARFG